MLDWLFSLKSHSKHKKSLWSLSTFWAFDCSGTDTNLIATKEKYAQKK